MESSIWYEKYAPKTLEEEILPPKVKEKFLKYVKDEKMPNLGFWSSKPGLGKSSTARAIIKSMNADAMFINSSLERGIDVLRTKIMSFASQESLMDRPKIVVMDECDNIGKDAQAGFRSFLDEFSKNCSFIFTGNYKSKIIEPLLDRLENYDFEDFDPKDMGKPIFEKLLNILKNEKVEIDDNAINGVKTIIKNCYPCIRSMIGSLQRSVMNGKFEYIAESSNFNEILEVLKTKDYLTLVQKVNTLNNPDSMYEFLYRNIDVFKNIPQAICFIADGQFKTETVRDKNLNLCATLVNLSNCL